jgi:hypothetical protein
VDGAARATITRIRTNSGAGGIQTQLLAVSNADYNDYWEGTDTINGSPSPTVAQYQSVTQRANLSFLCADGTIALLDIIAPQIGIFLSDGITVDATMITALITAAVGTLESTSGSLATAYLAGTLASK